MTTLNDADKARQLADEAHAVLLQADHDRAPHLLIALAKVYAELAKLTACPVIPQGTELAFHNQAGALVTVTRTQIHTGHTAYSWTCHGCGTEDPGYSARIRSKNDAEQHAAECTALQITTRSAPTACLTSPQAEGA
ncbi:hypothetical protein [Streptomyces mordarskii]|uniref:Uncharacterized protein n=1 Tax=Streptomyces mordarskii TaxID=1226758 RepID=A0ABN1EUP8_9ACTN